MLTDDGRGEQVGMANHRPDTQLVSFDPDALQICQVVDIHENLRRSEPELHQRQQAVPSGDQPRVLTMPFEQRDRLIDARRALVLERSWYLHRLALSSMG